MTLLTESQVRVLRMCDAGPKEIARSMSREDIDVARELYERGLWAYTRPERPGVLDNHLTEKGREALEGARPDSLAPSFREERGGIRGE